MHSVSERSQIQKATYCITTSPLNFGKITSMRIENSSIVARGKGERFPTKESHQVVFRVV